MRFSERFFKFPIRVYDSVSIKRNMKREMEGTADPDTIEIPDWVEGHAKLPYWCLDNLYYCDTFTLGRQPEDVAKEGFDMTYIGSSEFGEFECVWNMKRFESALNAFTEGYEKWEKEQNKLGEEKDLKL